MNDFIEPEVIESGVSTAVVMVTLAPEDQIEFFLHAIASQSVHTILKRIRIHKIPVMDQMNKGEVRQQRIQLVGYQYPYFGNEVKHLSTIAD